MTVIKGFNSDVSLHGHAYHVQTEDWGEEKSSIVTKVFQNGAVVKTVVSSYDDLVDSTCELHNRSIGSDSLRLAMQTQHHKILNLLHSGQLFNTP